MTIALKQVSEPPEPPHRFNPGIPPALEAVILRALEKDPARRFGDADEFIAALEAAGARDRPARRTDDATSVLQPTGPMVPIPPPGAYQEHVEQRYYGPPTDPRDPALAGDDDGGGAAKWWIGLLVGLLVAGAIVAGLLLTGKDKVQVPNMVGNPQAEAEIVLKRAGFSTDVTEQRVARQAQGHGHRPGPGRRLARREGQHRHADRVLRAGQLGRPGPHRASRSARPRRSSPTSASRRPRSARPATRSPRTT